MHFKDAVVFVTGGAGFIGSAVVRHLLDDTAAFVVNIDKLTYAASLDSIPQASGNPRYRFAQADICDGPALRKLFEQYQPRYVMNLAAESHVDRSIDGPGRFIQTNVVGTFTLLQEALRIGAPRSRRRRRAFASTMCRPTRFMVRSGRTACSAKPRPMRRTRPMPPARRRPIIWCGLARNLWAADPDHQLLEQLRSLSFPGKTDPAHDHQAPGATSRCRSMATAATSATGCMLTTTPGR